MWLAMTLLLLAAGGCSRRGSEPRVEPTNSDAAAPSAVRAVRVLHPPEGSDVAKIVRDASVREKAEGRALVVYVGATWCDPCRRFHQAVERGELDRDFPNLTLLEFDLDKDGERLEAAGYTSNLVPLFVLPGADGRVSDRRFEGSTKSETAISNITPRLRSLLTK